MGWWENTVYVRCADPARVLAAIDALGADEGMQPVAPPPPRTPEGYDPMQYLGALQNDLWGIAVMRGADGWCLVKTAPLDLLVERAPHASRMRLAELCARLECEALHFAAYDGSLLLTEVTRAGQVLLSGYYASGADPLRRYDEQIEEAHCRAGLRHVQLEPPVDFEARAEQASAALGAALGGANAAGRDNLVSVVTLLRHVPLERVEGSLRYLRWTGPSRQGRVRLPSAARA